MKCLFLDMDGTLTTVRSPWQFVHERLGIWGTCGRPLLKRYLASEITYSEFCLRDIDAWNQLGLSLGDVVSILDEIHVPPRATDFLRQAWSSGLSLAIISTGFEVTARRIVASAGLPEGSVSIVANSLSAGSAGIEALLRVGDGREVTGKDIWVRRLQAEWNVGPADCGALGDSDADIPMFDQVGHWLRVSGPADLIWPLPWPGPHKAAAGSLPTGGQPT